MEMTFPQVVRKWGTDSALAEDIGEAPALVKKWRQHNSIPGHYWLPIERSARRRGIENVTVFTLAEIAERTAQQRRAELTAKGRGRRKARPQ